MSSRAARILCGLRKQIAPEDVLVRSQGDKRCTSQSLRSGFSPSVILFFSSTVFFSSNYLENEVTRRVASAFSAASSDSSNHRFRYG